MGAACERFRPILMTTLAARLGALPLLLGAEPRFPSCGDRSEFTVFGDLLLSQFLTLHTTPAVYLVIDRLSRRRSGIKSTGAAVISHARGDAAIPL